MTPGDETSKPPEPGGGRDDHVRCFGCGKRIPGAVSTCPKCAAVQNALCECGATNSAYSTECFACHAELTPRTYSQRLTTLRAAVIVAILIAIAYTAYRLFPRDPYKARHSAFTEAASDFEQGRYEFSRVKFARYLEEHNEYAPARYMLGLSLYRSGRQDEGVAQVRRALEVDPDLEQAVEFLAIAAYDAGRIDEALKVSKEALAAGRTPWVFHLIAGKSLSHPGHMDVTRAAWHLRQALRNGIEDPEALLLLAEHTLVIERV